MNNKTQQELQLNELASAAANISKLYPMAGQVLGAEIMKIKRGIGQGEMTDRDAIRERNRILRELKRYGHCLDMKQINVLF